MTTNSMILNIGGTGERIRTPKKRSLKVDVMVVALGLSVALAGFFRREITWTFLGA